MVRQFIAQLDMIYLSAVDDFFHDGCKFFLPGSHEAMDCDQFKSFVGKLYAAFPDLCHANVEQIGEKDAVVSFLPVRATHLGNFFGIPSTGKEIAFTDIVVTRFWEGKIVQLGVYSRR